MNHPRTLVVSNNSFSHTSSNGRTLGNFFNGWPKERIAQFCISTVEPAYDICDNYYICTDKNALDAFRHLKKISRQDIKDCVNTEANTVIRSNRKSFKTSTKSLLRHFVWKNRWDDASFWNWVDDFSPEVVLLMNSDAIFILDIATTVAKRKGIPLVMFNTEGFYFFKDDFNRQEHFFDKWAFPIYQKIYRKYFEKAMEQTALSIYCNSALQEDYVKRFGGESIVLYTGSNLEFDSSDLYLEHPVFSYLGNFGFNRPKALAEVADVLQSINSDYYLDVYGAAPSKEIRTFLESVSGIHFHGMMPYEEVIKIMKESTILFHVEAQDECFKESLRYGFSTKIADSISSGRCFVVYSSPDVAGAKYILETGAGWFANNKKDLYNVICKILTEKECRDSVLSKAQSVAADNHDISKISKKFREALLSVL